MAPILAGAAALRLVDLGNRPMHCDEAVHADKFRLLLEHDDYAYNPYEYHGPSLNFLTLPIAWLTSADKLTEITEMHLRLLPAVFGIVLVVLVWLLRRELGCTAALWAALFAAVSPAMVFYSRYYIQEMLLVCFTFGAIIALWRFQRSIADHGRLRLRPTAWLLLLGLCIGMMHASKETCVIALASMAVAAAATMADLRRIGWKRLAASGLIVVATALSISALFFSSFVDNPRGVIHSFTTYFVYLGRSSGEGSVGRHVYPWHYYLHHFFWFRGGAGPLYTEVSIAALALVGLVAAALGKGIPRANLPLARFLCIYTVLMTVVYCALPYKTPWCALGFLHGMILLAGVGAELLVRLAPGYVLKALAIAVLLVSAGHLAWQAHRASFVAYEDTNNPYVYAHTTNDVPLLAERIEQIAAVYSPDARAMPIQVICPDDDHWPLPWYLRGFRHAGYLSRMPQGPAAPLIITQPQMEQALAEYIYVEQKPGERYLYVPVPADDEDQQWHLRPHVPLRVYIRHKLWEQYLAEYGD